MDDDQQFCLRWNNHQTTLISVFDTLLEKGMHVDCSLAAEGKTLKAHKVVLSACSPYFENVLSQQYDKHPIIILKDVKYAELRAMMDYMYRGEVNISQDQLAALLKAAESLQIKGLSDNKPPRPSSPSVKSKITESVSTLQSRESSSSPVPRKRKKPRRTSTDVLNHNHNEPLPTTAAPQTQTHTPLALPLPHPVPLAIPIAIPPSTPVIKPATEPINLNLENNIVPPTSKLKMSDIMNNITKNNKVDNNNMELGVAKLEFGSEGPEESVEDLTLDEEGEAEGEGGEEEEAGSSKYGDIVQNFQCYMERSQDEAALSGQDGPRDSQETTNKKVTSTPALPKKVSPVAPLIDLDKFDEEFDGNESEISLPELDDTKTESRKDMKVSKNLPSTIDTSDIKVVTPSCRQNVDTKENNTVNIPMKTELTLPCAQYATPEGYKCPNCQRKYNARKNLVRHVNLECGREPQFKCPHCQHGNHRRNELKRHIQKKHPDVVRAEKDTRSRRRNKKQSIPN